MLTNIHQLAIEYLPEFIYATKPFHTKRNFELVWYRFDHIININDMERWVSFVNKDYTCNFVLYDYHLDDSHVISALYHRRSIYNMALHAIINDKIQSVEHKEKYDQMVNLLTEFNMYESSNYIVFPIILQGARLIIRTLRHDLNYA